MGRDTSKHGLATTDPWMPLSIPFLRSRGCAELSPHGCKLLVDCFSFLNTNAYGNGDICLTWKVMKVRGWPSRETLGAAVRELCDFGLLFQTRQGSRLDCSLFALTIFPLNCKKKLDVRPGSYRTTDYMGDGAALADPPTEAKPAIWRRARKTKTVTPPRDKTLPNVPPRDKPSHATCEEKASLSHHGTKPHVFRPLIVPSRGTYIDKPSVRAFSEGYSRGREAHEALIEGEATENTKWN